MEEGVTFLRLPLLLLYSCSMFLFHLKIQKTSTSIPISEQNTYFVTQLHSKQQNVTFNIYKFLEEQKKEIFEI